MIFYIIRATDIKIMRISMNNILEDKASKKWIAPEFSLLATDGRVYSLKELSRKKPVVVMFLSNNCSYVNKILTRLVATCAEFSDIISSVAIMPNDSKNNLDDSYKNMKSFAESRNFNFPYLYDEHQEVAKQYGVEHTPEFFGFNQKLELQYHGRYDNEENLQQAFSLKNPGEMWQAMIEIVNSGSFTGQSHKGIGCPVKWKVTEELDSE